MAFPALSAQVFVQSLLSILLAQTPPQSPPPASNVRRIQLKQEYLCCFNIKFVEPIYPREARLAHIEGVVKLTLVIADDNSIASLQAISGDPLLSDSAIKAVRQWIIYSTFGKVVGGNPVEIEIPLSFTFKIEPPPKPAYLHLVDGKVLRTDDVREFTDRIEYTVGQHIHRISADSVTNISACARIVLRPVQQEGDCIPSGGPSFDITAIPLLRAAETNHSTSPPPR